MVRTGHWLWIYDSLNIHLKVRHEWEGNFIDAFLPNNRFSKALFITLDKHGTMINSTACLAVKIQNLPDWDVDWFDTKPQQSRQALTISDILPSAEDASVLEKRAV